MAVAYRAEQGVIRTGLKLWMLNGAFWFLLSLYVWPAWILGPDFKENAIGRELAPDGYVLWIRFVEVASILLALWQIWYFILRPRWRTGRLSFDGLFFLACWTLYLQEPWLNYNTHQFLYTTVSYNVGSWVNYVPGWNSPNGELIPVGSVIWFTAYLTLVGLWAFAGAKFMQWFKARRPNTTPLQLIFATFLFFIPLDFALENIILRTQLFNYASTVPELTLWAGQIHQFPLYEILSWCATLTSLSAIYYFRNDKGEMFAERGLSAIRFPKQSLKTFTRFVVIMGAAHTLMFVTYNVPYFYWSTKGGSFPPYAEYRIGGLCGPETNYDCPGLDIPLPKKQSPTNRTIPVEELPQPVD